MKRIYQRSQKFFKGNGIILAILLIGLFLRINTYTQNPPRGASSDEYTYTFLGMSLIESGKPVSWSYYPGYIKYGTRHDITIDNIFFPIVSPYFDHPPLNGILVGGWAVLNGQHTFQSVKLGTIRQIPIALGILSSLLTYILALKLYGKKTALWSLLIYSTATVIVMETRTVFAENLLTPLFLCSLLLFEKFKKHFNFTNAIILGIISGLALWTKELGVAIFLSILSLMVMDKVKFKPLLVFLAISITIFLLYPLYGYVYNWTLFINIVTAQGSRVVGPNTLYTLFFHPIIVNKLYYDGWYLVGFVSFFAAFLRFSKYKTLLISTFIYFFLMLFSLSKEGEMGWYMIPLFPFFSIFTASLLIESIEKHEWYIFVVSLFVGMYAIQYRWEAKYGLPNPTFRIFLILLFGPLFISYIFRWKKLYSVLSNSWFYFLIFVTALITYRYIHPL